MILLTSFPAFGDEARNPTTDAATRAGEILREEGFEVDVVELPCVFGDAAAVLVDAIDERQPSIVVCLGLAGARTRVSLERVAINCDDARIPDNAGVTRIDEEIVPGGPAAYFTTLPIKVALETLRDAGISAEVSQTAGTYVCNHVFYALMNALSTREGIRGGFVHLPRDDAEGLPLEQMARAVATIIQVSHRVQADDKIPAGALE